MFLFDPKAEKPNMLTAIDPPFTTPSAVDSILKTAKFEKLVPLTVIGLEVQIDELLKKVERLDVTEWLDHDCEARQAALKKLCIELHLDCKESLKDNNDNDLVLGDEVNIPEEITAKAALPYPVDLPSGNKDLWDAVAKNDDYLTGWAMLKRAGKDKDKVVSMAYYRNCYEKFAVKMQKLPWNAITKTAISDLRSKIKGYIIQGEEKAAKLLEELEDHLLHAGLIHKVRNQRFHGVGRHPDSNHFLLTHEVPWVLKPGEHSWGAITSFIKREFKKHAFREGKNKISTRLDNTGTVPAEIEIVKNSEDELSIYIHHFLTEHLAASLTQETDSDRINKMLMRYAKAWYTKGKFPSLDEDDID